MSSNFLLVLLRNVAKDKFSFVQYIINRVATKRLSLANKQCLSHPDAVGAQLQHLEACEVLQVGDAADFVVKKKEFL